MTILRSRARWMARKRRSLWMVRSIVVILGNSWEKRGKLSDNLYYIAK
jgi:hypothetical protein